MAEALARGTERIDGKPVCLDSDGDGICDADERILGTNPFLMDSDGDGYPDGLELALGSDPLDPKSIPDIRPPGYFVTGALSIQNVIPIAMLTPRRQGATNAKKRLDQQQEATSLQALSPPSSDPVLLTFFMAGMLHAQSFPSGSTGADGNLIACWCQQAIACQLW